LFLVSFCFFVSSSFFKAYSFAWLRKGETEAEREREREKEKETERERETEMEKRSKRERYAQRALHYSEGLREGK
jgi:Flp pilus assembly protein TadB